MKVMCIKRGKWFAFEQSAYPDKHPEYGEIVTASQCPFRKDGYSLKEYPTFMGKPASWNKDHFIPLSDIDETELVKQREKELINQ